MWLFKRKKTVTPPESPPEPHPMTISDEVVAEAGQKPQREFVRYEPLPGVIPEDIRNAVLAMDSTPYDTLNSQCLILCTEDFRAIRIWHFRRSYQSTGAWSV